MSILREGDDRSELLRRRDELAREVTELHWDLGGLTYEMAIRDHFRLDVLVRRAAKLQDRDAELAEVERLLRLDESPRRAPSVSARAAHAEPDASTAVLDALLAPSHVARRDGGDGGEQPPTYPGE